VEVELGGLGRGSGSSFSLERVQDASDHGGLGNEGDDLHLFPALPAGQGVDLVRDRFKLHLLQRVWNVSCPLGVDVASF